MQSEEDVGTLQRLSPCEVFAHEAHNITAWPKENIGVFSDVPGGTLTSVEREKSAGGFSTDLLAEDEHGNRATIKNRLGRPTTSISGRSSPTLRSSTLKFAIWITADARPEHVSAVSWLKENVGGADFYLVKVEGVQVDNSRSAPLFTPPLLGPSQETRFAEQTKKEWDERDRVRYKFFEQLLDCTNKHTDRFSNVSPKPRGQILVSKGEGVSFALAVRQHESRAYL